jgi:hypothetical protein
VLKSFLKEHSSYILRNVGSGGMGEQGGRTAYFWVKGHFNPEFFNPRLPTALPTAYSQIIHSRRDHPFLNSQKTLAFLGRRGQKFAKFANG